MTNTKKQQNYQSDNFFEAFRDLGNDIKSTAASLGSDVVKQLNPLQWGSDEQSELPEFSNPESQFINFEKEKLKREKTLLQHQRRQEMLVFSRREEETRAQIEALQKELQKVIAEVAEFATELEVAIEQNIVNPGVYHLNFFEKLRQVLVLLRKKIHESNTWMHAVNMRSTHKSYFWGQVGKSGTKFMLSQERTLATQSG